MVSSEALLEKIHKTKAARTQGTAVPTQPLSASFRSADHNLEKSRRVSIAAKKGKRNHFPIVHDIPIRSRFA